MLQPEQDEQLELDDGEVPLQQQHVRADGGGEAELDGQEQRDPGVEERGLADGSDGAAARRALSWRAGRREVRDTTRPTTYHLLPTTYYLLPATYDLLPAAWDLLLLLLLLLPRLLLLLLLLPLPPAEDGVGHPGQ